MHKASPIVLFGILVAVTILVFQITFGNLRQQDLSRSTKEREAVYSMVEQYAMDAMEKYVATDLKVEGVVLLEDGKEPDVKSYVESQMAAWDAIKTDVDNIELSNVSVSPGSYGTESSVTGHGGITVGTQTREQLPYYDAILEGDVKRLVHYAGDAPTLHFKVHIHVIADHIKRRDDYIK